MKSENHSFELKWPEDDRVYGAIFSRFCKERDGISFVASLALLPEKWKSVVQAGIALTEPILERVFADFVRKSPDSLRNKKGSCFSFHMS